MVCRYAVMITAALQDICTLRVIFFILGCHLRGANDFYYAPGFSSAINWLCFLLHDRFLRMVPDTLICFPLWMIYLTDVLVYAVSVKNGVVKLGD